MPQIPRPGVSLHKKSKAFKGVTLFSPMLGERTHLIDMSGEVVHSWKLSRPMGVNNGMLLPGGRLFISEASGGWAPKLPAASGLMRIYDWNGKVLWEHRHDLQHHDARPLPNGGAAYIAWEKVPKKYHRRIKGGLKGTELDGDIWGDTIREVNAAGELTWHWRAWEHMKLEDHPIVALYSRQEFAHANTLVPLKNGDYMINFRVLNTFLIVDRKTKKVKWQHRDDALGGPHDPHQLPNGNILVFANGCFVPEPEMPWPYSRVVEINPKTRKTVWSWQAPYVLEFSSPHISGAQRLKNGNTLITEGGYGRFFEVTKPGEVVWEYVSPYYRTGPRGKNNSVFRAKRYAVDGPEIERRVKA